MAKLRPFRDYSEHDVNNLFAYDGSSATRGLVVKLDSSKGWKADQVLAADSISNSLANAVSDRHVVQSRVDMCTSGDQPFGILLYDVAETDENGEKLIFNPRKAAEMQTVVSGQAVPILTKGTVLVNGIHNPSVAAAGGTAWALDNGDIGARAANTQGDALKVGTFLGPVAANGDVLVKLEL